MILFKTIILILIAILNVGIILYVIISLLKNKRTTSLYIIHNSRYIETYKQGSLFVWYCKDEDIKLYSKDATKLPKLFDDILTDKEY